MREPQMTAKYRYYMPRMFFCLIAIFMVGCSPKAKEQFSETGWARQVESASTSDLYAAHYKDGIFFNPWLKMKDKSFFAVLGWKLSRDKDDYTADRKVYLPTVIPDARERIQSFRGDFIMWIGHNTFLIRIDNRYWLTDPIFSKRALLPARKTPPALSAKDINDITDDISIIISHNHYDHLDAQSIKALPRNAKIYVPKGLKGYVEAMNKDRVYEMDWFDSLDGGHRSRITCLPAQHWSMRIGMGRNKSLWASYLLETPHLTFYFGGDSGYFKGFREFGKKFPEIDYAFMATTAYDPRWFMHYQHMNVPEAVKGFEELGAKIFIPTQWGTFHLGDEPVGVPALDLKEHILSRGLDANRFKILDIGEILPIDR